MTQEHVQIAQNTDKPLYDTSEPATISPRARESEAQLADNALQHDSTPLKRPWDERDSSSIGGLLANKRSRLPFKPPMRKSDVNATPDKSLTVSAEHTPVARTHRRVSSTFKPPSLIKSGAPKRDDSVDSVAALQREIKALEARVGLLRNALKIKKANDADGPLSHQRLTQLAEKWQTVGREAAQEFFDSSGLKDNPPNVNSNQYSTFRSRGFDEPAVASAIHDDMEYDESTENFSQESRKLEHDEFLQGKVEPEPGYVLENATTTRSWDVGYMMHSLGVDPLLFGWRDGDWTT